MPSPEKSKEISLCQKDGGIRSVKVTQPSVNSKMQQQQMFNQYLRHSNKRQANTQSVENSVERAPLEPLVSKQLQALSCKQEKAMTPRTKEVYLI